MLVFNHPKHSGYHAKLVWQLEWRHLPVHIFTAYCFFFPLLLHALPDRIYWIDVSLLNWDMIYFWSRKDNKKVKELFDALEKIKGEFESINRPILEVENSTPRSGLPPNVESDKNPTSPSQKLSETPEHKPEKTEFASTKAEILLDVKLGMDSLDSEVENSRGSSTEEINDWEFDAFEKDLKTKGWPTRMCTNTSGTSISVVC